MSKTAEQIRVYGTVQGVGFRPTVYRIAKTLGVCGEVSNDGQGVLIKIVAEPSTIDEFIQKIHSGIWRTIYHVGYGDSLFLTRNMT